jgi:hypothetical protein
VTQPPQSGIWEACQMSTDNECTTPISRNALASGSVFRRKPDANAFRLMRIWPSSFCVNSRRILFNGMKANHWQNAVGQNDEES